MRFDLLLTFEVSPFTNFLRTLVRRNGFALWCRPGAPASTADAIWTGAGTVLDGLLVESPLQARAAEAVFQLPVPVVAIPLLAHVQAPPPRGPASADKPFRVAFLGRFDRPKGVLRLANIWRNVEIGPARLDFYGDGPERNTLTDLISRLGLEQSVRVHGGWDDAAELAEIMSRTDLVVLPSETEGLPLVLLEAMAHGVPFVATDVGAIRTLAEDNPDVRVVPLDDAEIARGIADMAEGLRSGLVRGDRLQAYFQKRYAYEKLARRWLDVLLRPESVWSRSSASQPRPGTQVG